jgi:hypothetical protein
MGDRHTHFEYPMLFVKALYIFFILNSLIPVFLDTLYAYYILAIEIPYS